MKKAIIGFCLACMVLLPLFSAAYAGTVNQQRLFTAEAITATDTADAYVYTMPAVDGFVAIIGRVVSATSHREVKIETYLCDETKTYCALDDTLVSDWSSVMTDDDTWQKIGGEDGITIGKAPIWQIKITGLTDAAAAVDLIIFY